MSSEPAECGLDHGLAKQAESKVAGLEGSETLHTFCSISGGTESSWNVLSLDYVAVFMIEERN